MHSQRLAQHCCYMAWLSTCVHVYVFVQQVITYQFISTYGETFVRQAIWPWLYLELLVLICISICMRSMLTSYFLTKLYCLYIHKNSLYIWMGVSKNSQSSRYTHSNPIIEVQVYLFTTIILNIDVYTSRICTSRDNYKVSMLAWAACQTQFKIQSLNRNIPKISAMLLTSLYTDGHTSLRLSFPYFF